MNISFGSIEVVQRSRQLFCASRFFKTMSTGALGAGKRRDSLKRAHDRFGFVGRFPLAVDGREAARIKHAFRLLIAHFEEVLAEIRVVDRSCSDHPARAKVRSRLDRC